MKTNLDCHKLYDSALSMTARTKPRVSSFLDLTSFSLAFPLLRMTNFLPPIRIAQNQGYSSVSHLPFYTGEQGSLETSFCQVSSWSCTLPTNDLSRIGTWEKCFVGMRTSSRSFWVQCQQVISPLKEFCNVSWLIMFIHTGTPAHNHLLLQLQYISLLKEMSLASSTVSLRVYCALIVS